MYELLQLAAGGLKALDAHVEAPKDSPLFQRYPPCWKSRSCWPSSSTTSA
jgi:hypothetical protein